SQKEAAFFAPRKQHLRRYQEAASSCGKEAASFEGDSPMKVITVASGKGGSLKTSVSALLAVRATAESLGVAMFDLNADQGNLAQWWTTRREPMNPRLLTVEKIGRDVDVLRSESRYDWLIIDTPPLDIDIIETAIVKADAVVVPVRPSMLDIGA